MIKIKKVPVVKTLLSDLYTPLLVYLKLANCPYSYLLESFEGGEKWGRYSFIGLQSSEYISVQDHTIQHIIAGNIVEEVHSDDPLTWIESFKQRFDVASIPELPLFSGGLVGYFSYDTVRYVEKRLAMCPNKDTLQVPDILLMLSEKLAVFDNIKGKLHLIVYSDPDEKSIAAANSQLSDMEHRLQQVVPKDIFTHLQETTNFKDFQSNQTTQQYEHAIEKIKQYIIDGDVMQVVYSQRFSTPYKEHPLALYRALRSINPSPYLYYFDFDDFKVVGSSPEILVRKQDDTITVRPIAGTRPRGETPVEDKQFEKELLADEKELAEHLMLIDLGRNDVGRVSKIGSVKLTDKMIIERYSHVMHIVSNIEGTIDKSMTAIDALKATLPAGTLSGAPKVRAMEIIDELEQEKRGIYGGAVGHLGWNDNLDVAIAIRTAIIKEDTLYIQSGGGIVADSHPQKEWEETINKASAIFNAVKETPTFSGEIK